MRKVFYFLVAFIIIGTISFYSCSSDNNTQSKTSNQLIKEKTNNTPLVIGKINKNDVFEITADQAVILDNWNYNLLKHANIDAQLTSLETFKEGTILYLRAKGVTWASTLPLEINSSGLAKSGTVACTSNDCSLSTTGCLPQEDKTCSNCMQGRGDCTRTVTSSTKAAITDMYLSSEVITVD